MAHRRVPDLAEPRVRYTEEQQGGFELSSAQALRPADPHVGVWVARWAERRPHQVAFAERSGAGWRSITWQELSQQTRSVAQALLHRELSLQRPVAILSANGIDHAVLSIAAALVGVPVVPVSAAYSLLSRDYAQLRQVLRLTTPGLVFCAQGAPFAAALDAVQLAADVEIVVGDASLQSKGTTPWSDLLGTAPTQAVPAAAQSVGPDTVAKIMMTSGSTEAPKGVLTTHGMLTANQQAMAQVWPFVEAAPPVLVDWLPWSHTFGGSHNFNLVLRNGGTMYIDEGRPAPGRFSATLANLAEIAPTIQFNVPAGYGMLVQALEDDAALAKTFFSRIDAVFYAAAAMPQDTWQRLDRVAERTLGHRVWMTTAWGSTETSPLATSAHFALQRAGNIGVPVPGTALRFVPSGDKLELRVKGPNVTPGYHRDPERTKAAFDERGYYRIGDAGRLVDPSRPESGIIFDGRVTEDFKLSTGTWVNVAAVRTAALSAAGGLLSHAVVAGHDADWLALLAWVDSAAAARLGCTQDPTQDARVHAELALRIGAYNEDVRAHSKQVRRLLLLSKPPDLDAGEITDKGYVNARAVLTHRASEVARVFGPKRHGDMVDVLS